MKRKMDDRPTEHKPSTKLLRVHIDDTLTWVIINSKYFPDSDWLRAHA